MGEGQKFGGTYNDVFKTSLYVSPKCCYMLPKIFWTIHRVRGTFPPSEILRGKRTKILGKHIATFSKHRYMCPQKCRYIFPQNLLDFMLGVL